MGSNCSWKHIARTEERLACIVAMHLREVHGIDDVSPDLEGRIKNLFSYPTTADAAASADLVMKEYNCDMDPECTWRYIVMTEKLIADGQASM